MERQVPYLESDASLKVLFPILGLLVGLGLGGLRVWLAGISFPDAIAELLVYTIAGSVSGMLAVLISVFPALGLRLRSLRSLAILGLFAGFLLWFATTFLRAILLGLLH
jgi:hypothetical protein